MFGYLFKMIALVQRVANASIIIDKKVYSKINQGLLILLGIHNNDNKSDADYLCKKIRNLRIFSDKNNKMNLSVMDINKEILLVSQFTLYGKCEKGNRPSFIDSASSAHAEPLYNYIISQFKNYKITTETGKFGANMQVNLVNDGPVTLIINSKK